MGPSEEDKNTKWKKTYIDPNPMSIPTLAQSTHGRTCERTRIVVRHPHVHPYIAPLLDRLLHLDFSTLIRPSGEEIQRLGANGKMKRRLSTLGIGGRPTRSTLIRRPIVPPNRLEDPPVFGSRHAGVPIVPLAHTNPISTHV